MPTPPLQLTQMHTFAWIGKQGSMAQEIELGLDTFGDVTVGPDGRELPYAEVIRNVVAEGVLADQVGIDFIGLGEHHRDDYAISSPEVALAAIAAKTERIRLGSAVTVLSSDDPVRVFQRFATLDAVSDGRAEVILGRGSFTESFPLFGYELSDYERLFEEKLGLFAELVKETPVTWSGSTRAGLTDHDVFPKTANGIKTWVGVGGSPESVVRAARHGLPAHARDHRRRAAPLRALRRPVRPRPRPARAAAPARGDPLARLRRRDRRRRARGLLPRLPGHARPHRQGPRLAAARPRVLRAGDRARLALRRIRRDRRPQDRRDAEGRRRHALRPQVQRGPVLARAHDGRDRALRHDRRAHGARHPVLTRRADPRRPGTPGGGGTRRRDILRTSPCRGHRDGWDELR
ncbi:LLM class flavin-dependent oxidoreductase [Clavibacter zhangzhiyongii]|uniref:LLM class flavin-dependent oxidoreductase n=1 Tax=Clavibacter zhangzhiyongii TaxID=2768071 RepID=UPI0039E046D3